MSFNQGSGYTTGYGSQISFGAVTYNGGTGTVASYNSGNGASAAHVAQSIDISSPDGEVGEMKVTNNDSPGGGNPSGAHEYAPGMTDMGTVEFDVVYVKGKHQQVIQRKGDGIIYGWKETFPDGSAVEFPGFIKKATLEGKTEDGALTGKITVKQTGPEVWS